ncbi:SMI1/KNR4 family protein [Streptomyces sp. URMC 123]|uniref:SMI1/KNR4 family protein n=1 Tax=Streptomyces sp. URMC 123 TaxID=3423403 RepID=UPI003F1CA62F
MTSIWTGVRERVLALRTAPGMSDVFGAVWLDDHGHRFELLPPLTPGELHEVEGELGVRLPEEYRGFLLEVGAGGAGPDYGIFPLRPGAERNAARAERLAEPFRPDIVGALFDEHQENEPTRDGFASDEEFLRAYHAWDTRDDELREQLFTGVLYISDQGCGYYSALAVTGPEAGTVWDDVQAVGEGAVPKTRPGAERLTFAEWYLDWLARAERTAWAERTTAGERTEVAERTAAGERTDGG